MTKQHLCATKNWSLWFGRDTEGLANQVKLLLNTHTHTHTHTHCTDTHKTYTLLKHRPTLLTHTVYNAQSSSTTARQKRLLLFSHANKGGRMEGWHANAR